MSTGFDSTSLSPVPISGSPCQLPYGLEWSDFERLLPVEAVEPSAWISHEKRGLNGGENSCILTVRAVSGGEAVERVVFVKRIADASAFEGERYRSLRAHGVGTPAVLVRVLRGGAEVLVLEFLPRIGIDFRSPAEVAALLRLTARVNAVPVSGLVPQPRVVPVAPSAVPFDERVLAALRDLAALHDLGASVGEVFDAYLAAQQAMASFALAVTHGELYFQQVGWRQEELCVFDLETLEVRPRFWDVATILPRLVEETGSSEADLFRTYLEGLPGQRERGEGLPACLVEMRAVRLVNACWSLPWRVGAAVRRRDVGMDDELAVWVRWMIEDARSVGL